MNSSRRTNEKNRLENIESNIDNKGEGMSLEGFKETVFRPDNMLQNSIITISAKPTDKDYSRFKEE